MLSGVILWTITVSVVVTIHPELVAGWLLSAHALEIIGYILISIGFLGGLGHSFLLAEKRWVTSHYDAELTEWDYER